MTEPEVRKAIADGRVGGISLDTNAFDRLNCDLSARILRRMDQFKGTGVSFILSDVVAREVRAHILREAADAQDKLSAAVAKHSKVWKSHSLEADVGAIVDLNESAANFAQGQIDAYLADVGGQILVSHGAVDLGDVLDRYFDVRPPFEDKVDKKNEFPDAFALLALEGWGNERKKLVLAVTKDAGWFRFAEQSEWLVCVETLASALGHFNHADAFVVARLATMLSEETIPSVIESLNGAIESVVDDLNPHVDAEAGYQYDAEYEGARIIERRTIDFDDVVAIASDEEGITVSFEVDVAVEADAGFSFYLYDEGDSVPIGSASSTTTVSLSLQVTMVFDRDLDPEPTIIDIEVSEPRQRSIDFGYVEPDWG